METGYETAVQPVRCTRVTGSRRALHSARVYGTVPYNEEGGLIEDVIVRNRRPWHEREKKTDVAVFPFTACSAAHNGGEEKEKPAVSTPTTTDPRRRTVCRS